MSGDFAIGQRAAIYVHDYEDGRMSPVTIERDTKLYWIADGRRFRKSDGLEPGSTSNWGRGKYLLPLDDPKVIHAAASARKRLAFSAIIDAQQKLNTSREDLQAIEAVKVSLDAYAELISGLDA